MVLTNTSHQPFDYQFTVFTATFNRSHTLHRVYESLESQTFRDFEWLIVDDGSSDGTADLVRKWQAEASFPIRYLYQENGGMHIAINRGAREARGRCFLKLDSDDACLPTALERFKFHWDHLPPNKAGRFAGIFFRCLDQNGIEAGSRFPFDPTDSTHLEMWYGRRMQGEQWPCVRTDILRRFPYPEEFKKVYYPEAILYKRISREYLFRYVNEALRIYWIDEPSIVHGQRPQKNAFSVWIETLTALNEELEWLPSQPVRFLRFAVHYSRFSFHLGRGVRAQGAALHTRLGRFLWGSLLPAGFLLYLNDLRSGLSDR